MTTEFLSPDGTKTGLEFTNKNSSIHMDGERISMSPEGGMSKKSNLKKKHDSIY